MRLILGVLGENAEPLGRNARQALGPDGGSIGHASGCIWRLPDPNTLSGHRGLIAINGIRFTITDTSTNGVYINTAPLGHGNRRMDLMSTIKFLSFLLCVCDALGA